MANVMSGKANPHILDEEQGITCTATAASNKRHFTYSLRLIILFINIDVSRYNLVVDISVLVKSNIGQRE
jgi:hypothetical protein